MRRRPPRSTLCPDPALFRSSLEQFSVAALALALAGASLGFLRFNFHPASIFMGSAGTYPLGFALAVLSFIGGADRKSTRLNSSHANISYAVFCLKKNTSAVQQTHHMDHLLPAARQQSGSVNRSVVCQSVSAGSRSTIAIPAAVEFRREPQPQPLS